MTGGAVQAGLAGLHKNDCWDSDTHEDCLSIVSAVLDGLADGGYMVVPNAHHFREGDVCGVCRKPWPCCSDDWSHRGSQVCERCGISLVLLP